MALLPHSIEDIWTDFVNRAADYVEEYKAATPEAHNYTTREDQDFDNFTKGKLIRLDVAIMALHLFSARWCFRALPNFLLVTAQHIQSFLEAFLEKSALRGALGRFAGSNLVQLIAVQLGEILVEEKFQTVLELRLRTISTEIRRDLFGRQAKVNPKRVRKTKLVYTRHPIAVQRKTNTGWRSPQ